MWSSKFISMLLILPWVQYRYLIRLAWAIFSCTVWYSGITELQNKLAVRIFMPKISIWTVFREVINQSVDMEFISISLSKVSGIVSTKLPVNLVPYNSEGPMRLVSGSISIAIDLSETRQGWREQLEIASDLFIWQIFMEFLLCARHCAKYRG